MKKNNSDENSQGINCEDLESAIDLKFVNIKHFAMGYCIIL